MSLAVPRKDLILYGDKAGKVSFLNLETSTCTHLVPSLRPGMDKYRSVLTYITACLLSPL